MEQAASDTAAARAARSITVLNVDDDEASREATSWLLRGQGYDVAEAGTGHEALDRIAEQPDLVVLDVRLPDVDGFEICRRLKSNPGTGRIPVLMLSGIYLNNDAKVEGLESGADGYLTKPVEPAVLIATVKALLRMRQAETAARASGSRWRAIIETEPESVQLIAADGTLLEVNPAGLAMLEVDNAADVVGTSLLDWIASPYRAAFRALTDAVCNGDTGTLEFEIIGAKGGHRWMETRAVPLLQDSQGPVMLAVTRDMTLQKQAHQALQRQTQELARSNAELEQFAYVASHDLQEPLRTVVLYLELLARRYRGRLDTDADEFINFAVDGAKRMQALINDLLALSRVGTRGGKFERTDCAAACDRALMNLHGAIEEYGAVVTREPLPIVAADTGQIVQLFQNLIGNAVKFRGGAPPQVHVSAVRDGSEWVFAVRDNGIGIDPAFAADIFKVFRRLETRQGSPGTGIGLAICKKIVERHGGRIWCESKLGQGSVFRFTIPAQPSAG